MTKRRYATITMDCALDVDTDMGDEAIRDAVSALMTEVCPRGGGVTVYNPDGVEVELVPDDEPEGDV